MNGIELKAAVVELKEDELPLDIRFAVAESSLEREKTLLTSAKSVSTTLNQLREGYKNDLNSLLGSEMPRYHAFSQRKRERANDIRALYTATPEGEMLKKGLKRQLSGDEGEFLSSLKVDVNQVRKLQRDYMTRAAAALESGLMVSEKTPYVLVSPAEVPKYTENPWGWFYPPYGNKWGWRNWDGSGGSRWVISHENEVTGVIGTQSDMHLHGADDSDYSYTNARSEIWVTYRMPAAGLIEAWLDLQPIDNRFSGCLEDEFGFSDANIQQLCRAYMQVASPGWGALRYMALVDYRRGEDEGCWAGNICGVTPGTHKWVQLFSMDSYAAGQWVTVAIGVHDYNYFWVNDMSCDAAVTNRWFVRRIAMRSTGAP
jgi:hypothetical protein